MKLRNILPLAFLAYTGCSENIPLAVGFGENSEIVGYGIPTRGRVIKIDRQKSAIQDSTVHSNNDITYLGPVYYCIEPDIKFTSLSTDRNLSDREKVDLLDPLYWCDQRPGFVRIRPN